MKYFGVFAKYKSRTVLGVISGTGFRKEDFGSEAVKRVQKVASPKFRRFWVPGIKVERKFVYIENMFLNCENILISEF